jgi:hypothetical protein
MAMLLSLSIELFAAEYTINQISLDGFFNRQPAISDTGRIIWQAYNKGTASQASIIAIHAHIEGDSRAITIAEGGLVSSLRPRISDDTAVWSMGAVGEVSLQQNSIMVDPVFVIEDKVEYLQVSGTSGDREIMLWHKDQLTRLTSDAYDDSNPSVHGNLVVWQRARLWPFGWEIMLWDGEIISQLTTKLYYDKAPQVHDGLIVWYGWDGTHYQIYLHDYHTGEQQLITDTPYDNQIPIIENGIIVWEGYPTLNADIFMWRDGETKKISNNVDDDKNPRLWNGQVVWQGYDGDFFQIYHYDGTNTTQLTNTRYDNTHPDIRDGVITWMGFVDNFEPEIFVWTGGPDPIRLTNNDHHDQFPRTAGGRIVWEGRVDGVPHIFLAEPR